MGRIISRTMSSIRARLVLIAGAAVALLASCSGGQVTPVTKTGEGLHGMYLILFWASVAVFVGVAGAIVVFAVRYRRRADDDELPIQYLGNNKVELVWTVLPLVVVMIMFGLSWPQVSDAQRVDADPDLELEIEGFQWQWRFVYPEQQVEVTGVLGQEPPRLVLPVDRTINVSLDSNDVIHSFYIPKALYKLDVVPGQTNEFSMEFTEEGIYPGQCAEFCGLSHAQMTFVTEVVDEAAFEDFIREKQVERDVEILGAATCTPTGSATRLTIEENLFEPSCIAVAADETFDVELTNNDEGVNHNIEIYSTRLDYLSGRDPLFRGAEFTGEGEETYQVDALAPGRYFVASANAASAQAVLVVGDVTVPTDAEDLEFGPVS